MYSILITSYECHGKGAQFLRENLQNVFSQTYRPLQCIVSDHSRDNAIEDMVKTLDPGDIDFIYVRYAEHYGNPVMNWKNALAYATGDYLHYFAMDDRFAHPRAVANIVDFFERAPDTQWVAVSQIVEPENYVFVPRWNTTILEYNTVSGPSAVILRSELRHIEMDPQFIWYLDLDWYFRIWKEVGPPGIFNSVCVIDRIHQHQLTNTTCTETLKRFEKGLLQKKYGDPFPSS